MAEGQFTGQRSGYLYTDDAGREYLLQLDNTLATVANNGLVRATTANSGSAENKPIRFQPRGVHWESTVAATPGRKFLICGTALATLYASNVPVTITIDGVAGVTTGRKGERYSYLNLPSS